MRQFKALIHLLVVFALLAAPFPAFASQSVLYELLAAGTALSNSTTETVLASTSLAAYSLQRSKIIRVRGSVIATATNSTDTLNVKLRIGPTTLTGTVVGASGAVDVANNDVVVVDVECTTRAVPSTSVTVLCEGWISAPGAEATATARVAFEALALDTTVAQKVEITGTWSVASASNSCRADSLKVIQVE